jgi:hypothetical protein
VDRENKGFFWGYIIIAFVAIMGGILSIYSRLNTVSSTLFSLDPTPGPVITESQKNLQALAEKKLLDSDSDSINDFDEEYTYNTSAYLADTDSDGISDSQEITVGTDPTCAAGKVCFNSATANTNTATTNTNTSAPDITGLATDDPKKLRQQLEALGIDKSVLDQVSDADLVDVYKSVSQSTINTNAGNSNTNAGDPYAGLLPENSNTNSASAAQTFSDLQKLSPDAVRTLLVQSGMSASDVDKLDDATLMQVYQDALTQAAAETNTTTN